ncbi:uncharacterized protein LOC126772331 isoform X1 [Nymphalis io]|uniref:uncharacterized protein LOC126772331 isoform X1 n=2 Tax=Inachis io TaxID=171585 RepID=UPI002166EAB2|nr:uncharacterized protein LOC126772331 isoform X1 [Nymphalis io]XP_050348614.1 uncharacterized protein LOC126772331 isoform X1 [Nymphalis io]
MQCPIVQERDRNRGNVKMKTFNTFKNSYKKESNLDNIVDQLCTRLQDIKDQESASLIGMPTCSLEQTEAVRRYYAAFPALKKGQESPLQYYLPPPAWCRKHTPDTKVKMQSELSMSKDWNSKNKKNCPGKERRSSYHGQKKNNRRRYNSYTRSFESKENLPEWMTHEGVWDMETQDPVKEFIRAIALDEGYGTCENTVTDDIKDINQVKFRFKENMVPNWDDSLDFDAEWVITDDLNPRVRSPMEEELYAKFEAKFDRSIEALWSKDQNTPDDEYQDLPIDFQDLLSSPSDHLFADPSAEKCSMISLTESIWSNDVADVPSGDRADRADSPTLIAEGLHDRFRPLNIDDAEPPCPREIESFSLYDGDELYDALSTVAKTMRSFTAINHSRDRSGFVEVPPRRRRDEPPAAPPPRAPLVTRTPVEREDLLTSGRTHFRPIRREVDAEPTRYADGDTFDIRGDLDPVEFQRSESGGVYLGESLERYLEYRVARSIDYGRLNLTAAQRCPDLDDPAFRLRFPVRQIDAGVQTERRADAAWECDECGGSAKKMRPSAIRSIWSESNACECGGASGGPGGGPGERAAAPPPDELSREWEELLEDISAAHRLYASEAGDAGDEAGVGADRKRRHSAALRCAAAPCSHPHARFLHCCATALDRPLTR